MSEYKISYKELQEYIEQIICENGNEEWLNYKPEIMTALTGTFSDGVSANKREHEQLLNLWSNIESNKSKFLIDKKYIRIHDSMLIFIEALFTGGMFDAILKYSQDVPISEVYSIGMASSIVFALINILRGAVELEDDDFCLYLQFVTYYNEMDKFSKEDIKKWFPQNNKCNMKDDRWKCTYCVNSHCNITDEQIDDMIISLVRKKVIKPVSNDTTYYKVWR